MRTKNPYKIHSSGNKYSKQILNEHGCVVAMIEHMSNDTWKLYDMEDKPIPHDVCRTPQTACNMYRKIVEAKDGA